MNNYVTETELKGFIPELTKYLWTSESDFSKQKSKAEQTVISDLSNKGYLIRQLQPKLYLDTEESTEDNINGLRFVCISDSAGTIELQGSNDNETFETVTTLTFTGAETQSYIIVSPYKYYKVVTTEEGYEYFLVEISFDGLFAYKWLELIFMGSYKQENDQYYLRMLYFQNEYEKMINTMTINIDKDDSGDIDETEQDSTNSITIVR